jgi:hypothetical protein
MRDDNAIPLGCPLSYRLAPVISVATLKALQSNLLLHGALVSGVIGKVAESILSFMTSSVQ